MRDDENDCCISYRADIERLRAEAKANNDEAYRAWAMVQDLRTEIKRLRAVLQEIADLDPMTADVLTDDVGPMAREIAIRALK